MRVQLHLERLQLRGRKLGLQLGRAHLLGLHAFIIAPRMLHEQNDEVNENAVIKISDDQLRNARKGERRGLREEGDEIIGGLLEESERGGEK